MENNPNVTVFGNHSVKALIEKEGMQCEEIKDGEPIKIGVVEIESFSCGHAEIYPSIDPVWNSGFFISEKLFTAGILKVLNFTLWQKNV